MRSEEFERLRRSLQFRHNAGAPPAVDGVPRYDPDRPWDCVFAMSVHASSLEAQAFWTREVRDEA
eukprot:9872981-Lingulodinium_polyedra.AAC.1